MVVARHVVRLVNFGYSVGEYATIGEAMKKAESVGFEVAIDIFGPKGERGIVSYSPISGWSMINWN